MRFLILSIAALCAALAATPASSGNANTFSLEPAAPSAGQVVSLRVDNANGCYRAESSQVQRSGVQVEVRIVISDAGVCLPQWATPSFFGLGTFVPGVYEVTVVECTNAPVPCSVQQTLALVVGGLSNNAATVPTLSRAGLVVAVLTMLLGGLLFGSRVQLDSR